MRAIILAAGFGSRLMPLTKDMPKCMVKYKNKRLIEYQIQALIGAGITDIAIIGGYKFDVLKNYLGQAYPLLQTFYKNPKFDSTNMVTTLFCAKEFLSKCFQDKHDIIISYSDIVYFINTVKKLSSSNKPLSIVIDRDWQNLWKERFENPLSDAETLKINDGKIIEIGKKPNGYDEIQGQYIGLFKIGWEFLDSVINAYDGLDKEKIYDGKDYNNMYMTSFLQILIDKFNNAYPIDIHGGWCEIDSSSDLDINIIKDC
ncbi:phosphocholine cytidylyltransferase family protein [Helicobacter muridarum]|uniref:Phosphocholine cytidylyltransferase family protein n=1 Tax=Helicobacter muridarum TaxID=216 RepID=A0A099TZH9_9HELI|nr:phosphocholine cytidylyltransferase family protein [Helicobacter muridarum]TLD99605.1 phosphocholine cytidylyltransferase family protein [Helicobacter muridarum]STQ86784.1 sugar nucleotidyltransferase [Helicobacter muridarum]